MKMYNWDGSGDYDPRMQYKWRLQWLEQQIKKRESRGEKFNQKQRDKWLSEEKRLFENQSRDYTLIEKLRQSCAIIVPTHKYHNVWLRACLESLQPLNLWTLVAYDQPFYQDNQKVEQTLPSNKTFRLADQWLIKPKTWTGGVGVPHSWNMYLGVKMIKSLGFKYIFNINGDCILEKPEGFNSLFLDFFNSETDAVSCEYTKGKYFGTMSWFSTIEFAEDVWVENFQRMFQYNIGNAEARIATFVNKKGYIVMQTEDNPKDHHFKMEKEATWVKRLGFRHLHAEHKVRRWYNKEPVEERYFEKQFMHKFDKQHLGAYWSTGDKKHLKKWWGDK